MITMMEHPKHGRHPATGSEIEALKAAGWTVRAQKVPPTQDVVVSDGVPAEPRQKRPYNRRQA
jgi:hypothetical protein